MKLKLFQNKKIEEERIEIYYREHTTLIDSVIRLVEEKKPELIGISNSEEKQLLDIENIFYFETVEKKCFAYLERQVVEIKYTLTQLEEVLKEYGFVRINKSNIVSIYKVERVKCTVNMRVVVVLTNGEQLIISRHYKKGFEDYLKEKRGVM